MRTLVGVLWLPFVVLVLIFLWLWVDASTGWLAPHYPVLGCTLLILGAALAVWCSTLFLMIGRGSPHPFLMKTKHLVVVGPYGVVRNPMLWGVGAVISGLALLVGSVGLWFGFALFIVFVLWFIPFYEEPDMDRRFGDQYREYCREVPRWFPRLRHRHAPHRATPAA